VSPTRRRGSDAAELIAVEYNDLPAVTVAEKALAPGAGAACRRASGNLSFDWVALRRVRHRRGVPHGEARS